MDVKQTIPPQGKALVYVVRPNRAGGIIKFKFHVDGKHVGTTKSRQFLYSILNPGPHLFMSKAENRSEMQLNLEAGKTYFIKQKIKIGGLKARNQLIQVNEREGREMLQKCKLGKQIEMLITANTKSCISCGDQIDLGIEYCGHCGASQIEAEKPIPENAKPCTSCGKQIAVEAKFCTHCSSRQIETKPCFNCGKQIAMDAKFCPHCSTKQVETKPCINCGKQIAEEVKFCTHCGASQIEAEKPIPANTKPCISCGEQIDLDIEFCGHCGASQIEAEKPITANTKPCVNCREQIELDIEVCPHCGIRQIPTIDR